MRHWFSLYCKLVAGLLIAFVVTLHLFSDASPAVFAKGNDDRPAAAPRIAAWLERVAEEKRYQDKLARFAALPEPPIPRDVQRLVGKQIERRMRAAEKDAKAESAKQAKQLAARRVKQIAVRQAIHERQFMALGYASQPDRSTSNHMPFTQSDPRLPQ